MANPTFCLQVMTNPRVDALVGEFGFEVKCNYKELTSVLQDIVNLLEHVKFLEHDNFSTIANKKAEELTKLLDGVLVIDTVELKEFPISNLNILEMLRFSKVWSLVQMAHTRIFPERRFQFTKLCSLFIIILASFFTFAILLPPTPT